MDLTNPCAGFLETKQPLSVKEIIALAMVILSFHRLVLLILKHIGACAVSLYEAFRQKTNAGHYSQPRLAGEKLDHPGMAGDSYAKNDRAD